MVSGPKDSATVRGLSDSYLGARFASALIVTRQDPRAQAISLSFPGYFTLFLVAGSTESCAAAYSVRGIASQLT